ncbi:MAG: hypothetical protein J6Y19_02720 [Kiritimatiellae bacterium]|nr:hypothetical protein [Kiritimatiellia bacterium]
MNALAKRLLSAFVLCALGGGIYLLVILSPSGLDIRVKHWIGLLGYVVGFCVFRIVFCGTSLKQYINVTFLVSFFHAFCMVFPNIIVRGIKASILFIVEWILVIEGIAVASAWLIFCYRRFKGGTTRVGPNAG